MARPGRATLGGTFFDPRDAERAAGVLRAKKIDIEIEEVSFLLCPGAVRKRGWVLVAPGDEARQAVRLLKEAGYSHHLR